MKILIVLMFLWLGSCTNQPGTKSGSELDYGVQIIVINKCQYAAYIQYNNSSMVHAGNCNNPEHTKKDD